jgi:hypothetical protein
MDKALLVGINDYVYAEQLDGCLNDVSDMKAFLISHCGFQDTEIVFKILTDSEATKVNVLQGLDWLINEIHSGDKILFYYSGHGACVSEDSTNHEVICTIDFNGLKIHNGIWDTDFKRIFESVPNGVEFIWISDSCYSGGLLPDDFKPTAKIKTMRLSKNTNTLLLKNNSMLGITGSVIGMNVVLISSCSSDMESVSDRFNGRYNGVLTYYLLEELKSPFGLQMSLINLINNINSNIAKAGYGQVTQLEGSEEIKNKSFLTTQV